MNNTLKFLSIIFILVINYSCASRFSTTELKNNFSKEQISDLKKITDFFSSEICENRNKDFASCYKKILPKLGGHGWIPILNKVDFQKQQEMYSDISYSTFDEIWSFYKMTRVNDNIVYKSIDININGKYIEFLKELSKTNNQIKKYYTKFIEIGAFNPSGNLQYQIIDYPNDFNLNDPNIQLIISIQHLWENDINKRIDKWE